MLHIISAGRRGLWLPRGTLSLASEAERSFCECAGGNVPRMRSCTHARLLLCTYMYIMHTYPVYVHSTSLFSTALPMQYIHAYHDVTVRLRVATCASVLRGNVDTGRPQSLRGCRGLLCMVGSCKMPCGGCSVFVVCNGMSSFPSPLQSANAWRLSCSPGQAPTFADEAWW